ncbi:MAG: hypothetical protein JRJ39_09470 [Deltaproteobacteria bacterium]|nr:hypothetical protein [Deltaproteobacteria bacterium]MBW1846953.1 hypothetical protein [Deltaproteobacteria bacterium]
MTKYHIFVIRAILAGVVAVVLTRMFYGSVNPVFVIGLAIILLGLAYLSAYLKKK